MVLAALKSKLSRYRAAQYDWDRSSVFGHLAEMSNDQTLFRVCAPFGDIKGPTAFFDQTYGKLETALPDLERRDHIVISGIDDHGKHWIGCCGHYLGTFYAPFIDIPPNGHLCHLRFHEFYRFENDQLVEVHAIWDLPNLMMQANAWPMAPSLGHEWCVPGPANGGGLSAEAVAVDQTKKSKQLILDMLNALMRHPKEPAEAMEMDRYWHPKMNWYGPSGIGSARGVNGFRHWHQIPFLNAMPDRGQTHHEMTYHFIAEGNYVGVTGWPNMVQTISQDGWMGIAPAGKTIELRSLDFWRVENDRIRENWVLFDVIDIYDQIGVDVFSRLREFNKARITGPIKRLGFN